MFISPSFFNKHLIKTVTPCAVSKNAPVLVSVGECAIRALVVSMVEVVELPTFHRLHPRRPLCLPHYSLLFYLANFLQYGSWWLTGDFLCWGHPLSKGRLYDCPLLKILKLKITHKLKTKHTWLFSSGPVSKTLSGSSGNIEKSISPVVN